MDITRKTLPEQHYLYVDREAGFTGNEIADAMGSGFGEVFGFVQQHSMECMSMPVSMYVEMPNGPKMAFRCCMFVNAEDAKKATGSIKAGVIPAGDVATAMHIGSYANLNVSHKAIWDHCDAQGFEKGMPVWEHYIDDPSEVAEDQLRTELYRALA
ncbi:MAG: GyrI-like domain-containing protein [Gammaproteobacteria bacterium]